MRYLYLLLVIFLCSCSSDKENLNGDWVLISINKSSIEEAERSPTLLVNIEENRISGLEAATSFQEKWK